MRFERMDQIPEMCVMTHLIPAEYVQTWMQRNMTGSSHRSKHIKVSPVPPWERKCRFGTKINPKLGRWQRDMH